METLRLRVDGVGEALRKKVEQDRRPVPLGDYKYRFLACLRRGIDSCLPPWKMAATPVTIELRRGPCLLARRGCFGEEQLLTVCYTGVLRRWLRVGWKWLKMDGEFC